VATYEPTPIPQDYSPLRSWLATQLRKISDVLRAPTVSGVHFDILHAEPARYSDGDVIMADGADWNPGAGGGLYQRFGGAWVKL
jgi:hypothetical protein